MILLNETCGACPEQYDAYHRPGGNPGDFAFTGDIHGLKQVGYLRLRHGHFTVDCPDVGGELVYHGYPDGDGVFESDERDRYLRDAAMAIESWMARQKPDGS